MTEVDLHSILPHRSPFLWVDRVLEVQPGSRCVTLKRIEPDAPFFAGHFPDDPILPGVFLIEACAQTAGVMLGSRETQQGGANRLAAVNHFKFLEPVYPDSTIQVATEILVEQGGMAIVAAVVTVGERVVAKGELTVVSL